MSARCDLVHPLERGSEPCPRCLSLWEHGGLWLEMVRPLPEQAPPRDTGTGAAQCHDCAAADNLVRRWATDAALRRYLAVASQRLQLVSKPLDDDGDEAPDDEADMPGGSGLTWTMARVAVGNDRLEQYQLPGILMGLAHPSLRLVRPSAPGDRDKVLTWFLELSLVDEEGATCETRRPQGVDQPRGAAK